jgi:hypothetical protein
MHVQRFEDLDKQYFIVKLDDDDFSRTENHHHGFSFLSYELLFVVA